MAKSSFARLSPLARGRIIGLREVGTKRPDIIKRVKKKDGGRPCLQAVDAVLKKFREDPDWDGLDSHAAGGRPRDLTQQQEKNIRKILLSQHQSTSVNIQSTYSQHTVNISQHKSRKHMENVYN